MGKGVDYITALGLAPHVEQGFCRRTYSSEVILEKDLGLEYNGPRPCATVIFYAVPPDKNIIWHRILSTEIWFYQGGPPVDMVLGGMGDKPCEETIVRLGPDIENGQSLQCIVPANTWQMTRPTGDEMSLCSCAVFPGFDFDDWDAYTEDGKYLKGRKDAQI